MKRIAILALLSLSLSSCSEYFDKQQSKNELKKKYSFALNYYVRYLNHTEIVSTNTQDFQMSLITNLKTKEYGNEQTTNY